MLTQSASLHVDNRRKETPHVKKCPDAAFYSLASVVLDLQSAAKLFLVWWGGEGGGVAKIQMGPDSLENQLRGVVTTLQ